MKSSLLTLLTCLICFGCSKEIKPDEGFSKLSAGLKNLNEQMTAQNNYLKAMNDWYIAIGKNDSNGVVLANQQMEFWDKKEREAHTNCINSLK